MGVFCWRRTRRQEETRHKDWKETERNLLRWIHERTKEKPLRRRWSSETGHKRRTPQCSLPELEVEVRRRREFLANIEFCTLTKSLRASHFVASEPIGRVSRGQASREAASQIRGRRSEPLVASEPSGKVSRRHASRERPAQSRETRAAFCLADVSGSLATLWWLACPRLACRKAAARRIPGFLAARLASRAAARASFPQRVRLRNAA